MKIKLIKFASLLFIFILALNSSDIFGKEYKPNYEVNAPNMNDIALTSYYIDNNIFPANASPDVSDRLVDFEVATHLEKRFPSYKN